MRILTSILVTILIWIGLLWFEEYKSPGPSSYYVQIPLCIWFLMNAYLGVNPHEQKEVHSRFGRFITTLNPGFYFWPFFWFFFVIYQDPIQKAASTSNNTGVNFDQSKAVLKRRIGFWEGLSREFFIPFVLRNGFWAIFVSCFLGSLLGFYSVKYKNKVFYGIENNFDPIHSFFSRNDKKADQQSSYDYKKQNQESVSGVNSGKQDNSDKNNNQSYQSQSKKNEVWYPSDPFDEKISYDCSSIEYDNLSACKKVYKDDPNDSVRMEGYFVQGLLHGTKIPKMYVDGYKESEHLKFVNFFNVKVDSMVYKNGMSYKNAWCPLERYIDVIETSVTYKCYRNIVYTPKPQFKGKISWTVVDASLESPEDADKIYAPHIN